MVTLRGHIDRVLCVPSSVNGSRLASASGDCTVRLQVDRTGQEITTLRGHAKSVNPVSFAADDARLASASSDRTIHLCKDGSLYPPWAVLTSSVP